MAGKQAKILHDQQINDLLVFASATRNPLRNKLMVLLSVKAGLRAGEIAGLTWDMVLDPTGEVGQAIELHDCIAKKERWSPHSDTPDAADRPHRLEPANGRCRAGHSI
jgi:integrase